MQNFPSVKTCTFTTNIYDENYGSIIGKVVFKNNYRFEFLEVIDTDNKIKDKYRYHFMDDKNNLIFRFDNAPHHPTIKSFPHHKHTQEKILDSQEPTIYDVLLEIKNVSAQ
jgi:hypothetical protein